jgi:S-formylglutathione hydrolase FrmB
MSVGVGVASATPEPFPHARSAADGTHITSVQRIDARRYTLHVWSEAMGRDVELQVVRPADTSRPRPVLYLLDGAEDGATTTWETKTDLLNFVAGKNLNVVNVVGGRYTWYTDWIADDPVLGRNKWTTFLTRELPPVLNSAFDASGRNAIAGVSMSATSALMLAEAAPGLYRSVGSFSGCDATSTDPVRELVAAVIAEGGGNPLNMWGPPGSPDWAAADPTLPGNAARLRGTDVVLAAGNGIPQPGVASAPGQAAREHTVGGGLEDGAGDCTRNTAAALAAAAVPFTLRLTPYGTHSWQYWQADLHAVWPQFARDLGI